MRTISMLLGIPESDQEDVRDRATDSMRTEPGQPMQIKEVGNPEMYADYIDWRAEHPSDDLMTDMLAPSSKTRPGRCAGSPARRSSPTARSSRCRQRDGRSPDQLDRQGARRPSRPAARARRGSVADPGRHRGGAALRASGAQLRTVCQQGRGAARDDVAGGQRAAVPHRCRQPRRAAIPRRRELRHRSERRSSTSASGTASTTASVPRSLGWRARSPSTRCSSGSPNGRSTPTTRLLVVGLCRPRLGDPPGVHLLRRPRSRLPRAVTTVNSSAILPAPFCPGECVCGSDAGSGCGSDPYWCRECSRCGDRPGWWPPV